MKSPSERKIVLVAVLKNKRDQSLLLKNRWYRIPATYLPRRKFKYIAFYQPAIFGSDGNRIIYYACISRQKVVKRINLLPKETKHPRANDNYIKFEFKIIKKLGHSIKNTTPRRISFGFTSLKTLFSAKNILELYGVPATEEIVERGLRRVGIRAKKQHYISEGGRKYRLDLAVFSGSSKVAIECDNAKAHEIKAQIKRDTMKDLFLLDHGWKVARLKEHDIMGNLPFCVSHIKSLIRKS